MEFIYKFIQIFCFSATLEIRCGYAQSELIISHKAVEWHLYMLHIHVPNMKPSPSKGGGSFVGGLQKQGFVHPSPEQPTDGYEWTKLHSSRCSKLYASRKLWPIMMLLLSLLEYEAYA